ncbi:DUF2182 domain-containing protein [Ruegeria pomeroyi]|uniref:Membrane protein, putative n=2 Tax=Ruegeria pomeroyi TaxID=89184 RepID=Q5LTK8_RUEPO|nr:DUF2182 domain-containing protein [Ruegeria pomeroyi]AAV94693.1 membrane protein, putative [Ruegeria pomeroyi DSS-3]NVK95823.1 DUF2182 domain-containing protein [Ruegeria pomeroyi]NVL00198.1 DUF2182 domain-containing protein [Ruegeria pomeroyi]QWV08276.1 DUF2182 domain-containing protein [Ruegeria pomeroyi]
MIPARPRAARGLHVARRLRAAGAHLRLGPMPWLLALAATALGVSRLLPAGDGLAALCGRLSLVQLADPAARALVLPAPGLLVGGWVLMVLAMMPPLVSAPLAHLWQTTPRSGRAVAVALYGLAYLGVWILAGLALVPLALLLASGSAALPLLLGAALIWSASPPAQAARNRCHRMRWLPAGRARAARAALGHGLAHGGACLAACWPWMLVPLTVQTGHGVAMVLVAAYLLAERGMQAAPALWRVPPGIVAFNGLLPPGMRRITGLRRFGPGLMSDGFAEIPPQPRTRP